MWRGKGEKRAVLPQKFHLKEDEEGKKVFWKIFCCCKTFPSPQPVGKKLKNCLNFDRYTFPPFSLLTLPCHWKCCLSFLEFPNLLSTFFGWKRFSAASTIRINLVTSVQTFQKCEICIWTHLLQRKHCFAPVPLLCSCQVILQTALISNAHNKIQKNVHILV